MKFQFLVNKDITLKVFFTVITVVLVSVGSVLLDFT